MNMSLLNELYNSREHKKSRRVGRGPGSGAGKTSDRGHKGDKSRSGYKRRLGYEGGQFPLFKKLPIRGFSQAQFRKELNTINLGQIENIFSDGDAVNIETLRKHGYISGKSYGLKILGKGELSKNVKIEADAFSQSAKDKLDKADVKYKILEPS